MSASNREITDAMIRQLWLAIHRLCVNSELTDADVELWGHLVKHPAIQDRLQSAKK
jgi:hypothetical protein